ncbi:MAG: thermonuclease family protein [Desulforhopalus sp.]
MIRNVFKFLPFFLMCLISPVHAMEPFYGFIERIIDGDSLVVICENKKIEIRLYGIDCPEYNQPFSDEAKALVRQKVYDRKVLVYPQYYDSYKRLVAIIEFEKTTLNGALVWSGLAWVYPQYCRKKICRSWQQMEKSARSKKKGMWSTSKAIPPWKWKREKHEN